MNTLEAVAALTQLQDLASATPEQQTTILGSLEALSQVADYQLIGICAESQAAGLAAVHCYAQYFDYQIDPQLVADLPQITGAVYLKFNPRSNRLHLDVYQGIYRGGLISFQSDLAEGYSGTHGHFPLNIFDRKS
jgi:Domain of unknown function (DUF1824)